MNELDMRLAGGRSVNKILRWTYKKEIQTSLLFGSTDNQ